MLREKLKYLFQIKNTKGPLKDVATKSESKRKQSFASFEKVSTPTAIVRKVETTFEILKCLFLFFESSNSHINLVKWSSPVYLVGGTFES